MMITYPRLRTIAELKAWQPPNHQRYHVLDERVSYGFIYGGYIVVDEHRQLVDRFRSEAAAHYFARRLNGTAT